MNISYRSHNRIKFSFLIIAVILIAVIFIFLNRTIREIRNEERQKVLLWADAVQKRNQLLEYAANLFEKLETEELQKVDLWRESQQMILQTDDTQFLSFLLKIISNNKNIPIILTDAHRNVISTMNLETPLLEGQQIPQQVLSQFSKYEPLQVVYQGRIINYLYYSDSQLFNELHVMINDLIHSFVVEVVQNSVSVPVIITNKDTTALLAYGNITQKALKKIEKSSLQEFVNDAFSENQPISIMLNQDNEGYIFYKDSALITSLTYYPLFLFAVILLLGIIVYTTLSSFVKHEKDQLWVGMSKETAHQLGTPISSLMAWVEILKMQNVDESITDEINKDVKRLETIASRFSKIGSNPDLTDENVGNVIQNAVNYLKTRTSKNISSSITIQDENMYAKINSSLLAWVIENVWKNAVDAMQGSGTLTVNVYRDNSSAIIDVTDTGKGLPRNKFKSIFQPGYTTKSRGWGLGLSLAQRIIEEYHHGKIMVHNSEIDKGTTIRIVLPLIEHKEN